VIIVTHNANLWSTQMPIRSFIASAGSHTAEVLPPIAYVAGGLEEAKHS